MRFPPTLVALVFVAAFGPQAFGTSGDAGTARRQSAIIRFERPTWVATEMLIGSYLIVHDDTRMTRGEACTSLYRLGTRTGHESEVVAFHCNPVERKVVRHFSTTIDTVQAGGADRLVEYQFAGDSEGHGVPLIRRVLDTPTRDSPICVR